MDRNIPHLLVGLGIEKWLWTVLFLVQLLLFSLGYSAWTETRFNLAGKGCFLFLVIGNSTICWDREFKSLLSDELSIICVREMGSVQEVPGGSLTISKPSGIRMINWHWGFKKFMPRTFVISEGGLLQCITFFNKSNFTFGIVTASLELRGLLAWAGIWVDSTLSFYLNSLTKRVQKVALFSRFLILLCVFRKSAMIVLTDSGWVCSL